MPTLDENQSVETRDWTNPPVEVNWVDYENQDFYILEKGLDDNSSEDSDVAVYGVPYQAAGQLTFKEGHTEEKLNWFSVEGDHEFWSWTLPWVKEKERQANLNSNPIHFDLKDTYVDEFDSSAEVWDWKEGSFANGKILEQFLGAKSGPYNFKLNGEEVPLEFRHLMSKIYVNVLQFNGANNEDIQCEITFLDVPKGFTLYPVSEDNGAPKVIGDVTNPDDGITYTIVNPVLDPSIPPEYQERYMMYVCPEIDFSNIEFVIKVYDKYPGEDGQKGEKNARGTYWGNFKNLNFKRTPGTDYDEGSDEKILHAGEIMYMDLYIYQFGFGGGSFGVAGWNTAMTNIFTHHPHPGIYERADLMVLNGTSTTNMEQYYQLYGDGDSTQYADEEELDYPFYLNSEIPFKVFKLYGNITTNSAGFGYRRYYMLDGNGYTLTYNLNSTNVSTGAHSTQYHIGNCRDIYLTNTDGTIYIDKSGKVYWYNAETNTYEFKGSQIDGSADYYYIDFATGLIARTGNYAKEN